MAAAQLHLLIPGLRGPLPPDAREADCLRPRRPALERLFAQARAEHLPRRDLFGQLQQLFGLTAEEEPPAGALGWLGEGNDPGQAVWLRADPVHLRPDNEQMLLFDASTLGLTVDEAASLVERCNELLREDGLTLYAPVPTRWYLRSEAPVRLQTMPTATVAGRYFRDRLPTGDDASRWLALMTELQMLLHLAPENERRADVGRPTVNGIWLWGVGSLPAAVAGDWEMVIADEPVARGLAKLAGAQLQAVPGQADTLPAAGRCLVVLTALADALQAGDLDGWGAALDMLEQQWLAPLLGRLRSGELAALTVETAGLRLRLRRGDLRRFWRRPKPLPHYLEF